MDQDSIVWGIFGLWVTPKNTRRTRRSMSDTPEHHGNPDNALVLSFTLSLTYIADELYPKIDKHIV